MLAERPKCPEHPDGRVIDARTPGTEHRTWVCLTCGKKLGDAPEREAVWESMTIGTKK